MSKKHLEAQLVAGGMVAASAKVDANITEKVVARRYVGQALGDRVVVRLGADRLGPAEDLAMEFLGLQSNGESKPLAQQSRRALGFASWALITHPENAKYALNLVKRIKAAARKAKSKPGHAWDQFTEMADELNRSVRHFLPPFWEEAARIYKDLGNTTYAGRSIGKALEAERVHALEVDPIRRRDAVLEFTLSGCLSGKALTEYTKDLEKQFEPQEALETLRDLLVRRTMGGMAPMPTAAKDLGRFAKAAGKKPDEEIESFLESIIASPAMSRTPKQFWKSVSKHVAKLVAKSDAFGVWLLVHTDPQSSYRDDSPVWDWLDLLDQWKVLPLLGKQAKDLPEDIEIPGGRAGWIGRLMSVESVPQSRVFDLIDLAADAIRAEDDPIPLGKGSYYGGVVDVDVVEYCLELGLKLSAMPTNCELDFNGWLLAEVDHPRRNSQLKHLMADEEFRRKAFDKIPSLATFVGSTSNSRSWGRKLPSLRSFAAAAEGHDAIRDIWWEFLDSHLKKLEEGGLCDFESAMEVIVKCATRETANQFPEFTKRITKVDLPTVLQRTLAAGVVDEYGWELLDKHDDKEALPKVTQQRSRSIPVFPKVLVVNQGSTQTVGPDGIKPLGDFVLEKSEVPQAILSVQNDVMLVYRDQSKGYDNWIKWLSDPTNPHKTTQYFYQFRPNALIDIDDGVFYGTRLLRPGDKSIPDSADWLSDGERFWTLENVRYVWNEFDSGETEPEPQRLNEIDPRTGKKVRQSIPAWFEDSLPAGCTILWDQCWLMPAPQGIDGSPMGVKDGMIGWRVVRRRDGKHECRGIDGRECVIEPGKSSSQSNRYALGIVDQPEGKSRWIVLNSKEILDEQSGLRIANMTQRYAMGQALDLPLAFWHFFTVRCSKSSKKLRKIKLADAKKLFEAARLEHEALKVKEDPKNPDPNRTAGITAASEFLQTASARLLLGISRIARVAAAEQISLVKVINRLTQLEQEKTAEPKSLDATESSSASMEEIEEGLKEMIYPLEGCETQFHRGYGSTAIRPQQVREVIQFLKTGKVKPLTSGDMHYMGLIDDLPTAAWKTFWIHAHQGADEGVPVNERLRGPWLAGLNFWADSGFCDLKGKITVYVAGALDESAKKKLERQKKHATPKRPVAFVEGKVRYVAYAMHNYRDENTVILAYAENGKCVPPKSYTIAETIPLRSRWMSSSAKSFAKAVLEVNELVLPKNEDLQSAAEQLGMTPIQVALGWMGNFRSVTYGQEKLTKELRSHYGWKVAEIKSAVAALDADPPALSVLSEGARLNPTGCMNEKWIHGFRSMIAKWKDSQKATVAIPAEVVTKLQLLFAGRYGYNRLDMKVINELLADPDHAVALQPRSIQYKFNDAKYAYQMITQTFSPDLNVDEDVLYPQMLRTVCLLNYELPVGAAARRKLPEFLEALREFLDNDQTTFPFGAHQTREGYSEEKIDNEATLAKFAGVIAPAKEQKDGLFVMDSGLVHGAIYPPAVTLRFRSAHLKSDKDFDSLFAAAGITFGYESDGTKDLEHARFVLEIRSDATSALIASNRSDQFPDGSWEQDPRVSVPQLVAEVAKKLKVDEDAATLYLQVLSLHDPTNVRVKLWNGWSTKVLKAAAAQLLSAEHLVEAKRSRAGRDHFLPGGWEPLKLPNLPIETWKLVMFGYENTDDLRGGGAEYIVCPRPPADQFALAWNRVKSGDAPKYEDAATS